MAITATAPHDYRDDPHDRVNREDWPETDFSQEHGYDLRNLDQLVPARGLANLESKMNRQSLAYQATIFDMQAELDTLRLNALTTACELERLIARVLSARGQNPNDPNG